MKTLIENLSYLQSFLDEMNQSSSGNYKIEVIRKHKDNVFLKKVFHYTYNDFKKYGVHTKVLKKNSLLVDHFNVYEDLFQLLDDLAQNNLTGHAAVSVVNKFIDTLPANLQHLIYFILDRDLRMGASITSILKVHPNIVPIFKVALAHPYSPSRVNFETEEWYGSRKLDGVRCICRKEGNAVSFYSRNGKEFETLGRIADDVRNLPGNFILDGEVCMVNETGAEDFQGIMKEIRKKDHTIKNPKFLVFDCLTIEEFDTHKGIMKLSDRLLRMPVEHIKQAKEKMHEFTSLEYVDQVLIKNVDQFTEMVKDAELNGYEGIMVRKNSLYEGTRSHNLLKVKKFYDAEYTVLECVNGTIRWTENGQQIEKECLSNITIELKGCKVSVGSGFSKEQREYYLNRHAELIGKTVTIQYFEETVNMNGGYSLRFPVIKHIYNNGRDC
jgi:DNA ligase-1